MENFTPTGFLPARVTPDGRTVEIGFTDDASTLKINMPAPLNAQLIHDLSKADATARERFAGTQSAPGGWIQMQVRAPRTVSVTREVAGARTIVVFDHSTPTETAFALPDILVLALLRGLKSLPSPDDPNQAS